MTLPARLERDDIERVTDPARLRALAPMLDDLFRRAPDASPFQSPHWLVPWVEHLGGGAALRWLVIVRGGRAIASVPLMMHEDGGTRTLRWVGSGITDRQNLVIDPDQRGVALPRVRRALAELAAEVDAIELDELPDPSREPWATLDGARLERGSVCPVLALQSPLHELEASLPRWLRRNLRQTERRLLQLGRVEWRLARAGDSDLLETFLELHAARWRAQAQPGVLADPSVRAFHHAAAPHLITRGLLELEVGFLDARPLVASYVLRRTHAHLYLFGFDPAWPRLSLGSLAIWRSIARAARGGLTRYDFLRGCEPYKYAFGARNQQSYRWTTR